MGLQPTERRADARAAVRAGIALCLKRGSSTGEASERCGEACGASDIDLGNLGQQRLDDRAEGAVQLRRVKRAYDCRRDHGGHRRWEIVHAPALQGGQVVAQARERQAVSATVAPRPARWGLAKPSRLRDERGVYAQACPPNRLATTHSVSEENKQLVQRALEEIYGQGDLELAD